MLKTKMLETRKHLPTLNQEMAITVGQQLKATRMGRGLTLQQAADPLLLSVRQIECLEAGDSALFYGARLYAQAADKYASFLHIDVMPSQMMLEYPSEATAQLNIPSAAAVSVDHKTIEPKQPHVEVSDEPAVSTAPSISIDTSPETHERPVETPSKPSNADISKSNGQPPSRAKTVVTIVITAAVTASLVLNANQLEKMIRDQVDDMPSIAELTERFRSTPVEAPIASQAKEAIEQTPKAVEQEPDKAVPNNEQETLKPAPMPMVPLTPTVPLDKASIDKENTEKALQEKNLNDKPSEKPAPRNATFAVTDKTGLLVIRFGIDSWVQAVTKNGKRVERTYNEGDTLTVQPSNLQSLTIGNATQVKVTNDGNKFDLEPYSKGSVARFTGDQLESLSPPRATTPTKPASPTTQAPAPVVEKPLLAAE